MNNANKVKQIASNNTSLTMFNIAMEDLQTNGSIAGKKLRNCQAYVYETENFFILKSYETFVACIQKSTKCGFDVLRHEYCYTPTSAQHISKFLHDYGAENYRRYYPVK